MGGLVGKRVGAEVVGNKVGEGVVGKFVGATVGNFVGLAVVGNDVGATVVGEGVVGGVGVMVTNFVGDLVGKVVGFRLGFFVGETDGKEVGEEGIKVGAFVGGIGLPVGFIVVGESVLKSKTALASGSSVATAVPNKDIANTTNKRIAMSKIVLFVNGFFPPAAAFDSASTGNLGFLTAKGKILPKKLFLLNFSALSVEFSFKTFINPSRVSPDCFESRETSSINISPYLLVIKSALLGVGTFGSPLATTAPFSPFFLPFLENMARNKL